MLNNILSDAVKSNSFKIVESQECIQIFERIEGEAKRFIILYEAPAIQNVDSLNELIVNSIPEKLKEEPAFNKNTDLIVIYKLENLSEFKELENDILAIEEDPYHFKKYVLYYIDGEEALLDNKTYKELELIVSNQLLFEKYKSAPLSPSAYSIAARIFIKLPFLELPKKPINLTPLNLQVQQLISELGHTELDRKVQSTALNDGQIDKLIQELIKNEMENI